MPNQFGGYCYSTIEEAANADIASPGVAVAGGLVSGLSYTVSDSTSAVVTYSYRAFDTGVLSGYNITRIYPECPSVGQIDNNSGISVADALLVSWAVVACWAVAYWFRLMQMGSRGY